MQTKQFQQRIIYKWKKGCPDSDGIWDLPFTHRENVDWEIDKAAHYHFNIPRVVIEYSPQRWRVGTEDWDATLEFGLNILVAFVDDEAAWLLHDHFCREFLIDTAHYERKPGEWRIPAAEIKAWLVIQA